MVRLGKKYLLLVVTLADSTSCIVSMTPHNAHPMPIPCSFACTLSSSFRTYQTDEVARSSTGIVQGVPDVLQHCFRQHWFHQVLLTMTPRRSSLWLFWHLLLTRQRPLHEAWKFRALWRSEATQKHDSEARLRMAQKLKTPTPVVESLMILSNNKPCCMHSAKSLSPQHFHRISSMRTIRQFGYRETLWRWMLPSWSKNSKNFTRRWAATNANNSSDLQRDCRLFFTSSGVFDLELSCCWPWLSFHCFALYQNRCKFYLDLTTPSCAWHWPRYPAAVFHFTLQLD